MAAYYNEHDAYAAQWLRNLIAAGHIAPGDVDERDIRDVSPDDLRGYAQCHFFAGIGIWSYALRRAGWPDDRPVWTGSCPCQPFSAAGAGNGFADERHLWPHWFWLISQCAPGIVLGEQVASKDGLGWLDLVSTDLEGAGYAVGANDLCAAGFGGAHIRQRLYFAGVADTHNQQHDGSGNVGARGWSEHPDSSDSGRVGKPNSNGSLARDEGSPPPRQGRSANATSSSGGLAESDSGQRNGFADGEGCECHGAQAGWVEGDSGAAACGEPERLGNGEYAGLERYAGDGRGSNQPGRLDTDEDRSATAPSRFGATRPLRDTWQAGPLHDADWLLCRNPAGEPSWRPVEPGAFPLAHGAPSRVGRLRAYGNGLDAETATAWCEAVMGALDDMDVL